MDLASVSVIGAGLAAIGVGAAAAGAVTYSGHSFRRAAQSGGRRQARGPSVHRLRRG